MGSASSIQPKGPALEKDQDLLVSDLLSRETKEWNKAKINNLLPELANLILNIRPSKQGAPDTHVWTYHESGEYTAKSGYLSLQSPKVQSTLPLLNNDIAGWNWNKCVWSAQMLPKIKMFIWRIAQNALPTGENLQKQGLLTPILCCRCGEPETTLHLLFNCPFAREVWSLGPWSHLVDASQIVSFKEALISSGSWISLPPYGFTINAFPWICWYLWVARNNLVFEKKPSTAPDVILKAIIALKEWDHAQSKIRNKDSSYQIITRSTNYQNLHPISICCNTDAAWRSDTGVAGLAWIFTDLQGKEISRGSLFQEHVSSAIMAEALAIRNALHHAINLKLNTIWLKSDSQVLIGAITAGRHPTELYGVLSDIAALSRSSSLSCRFSFIKRELNGPADLYAKACLHSGPSPSS